MLEVDLVDLKPETKKVLLVGPEGSGKTRFIRTMPKPTCVFSFDKGITTLAGEPGIKAYVFMDEDRYHPKAWTEFLSMYTKLRQGQLKFKHPDGTEEPYKTMAVDSVTALSKFILDHANYVNNTIDAKVVGFEPYTRTKSFLQDVVIRAILAAEYFVCTALIELDKDEKTGQLFYRPSTEGKFREEIGQWFDVVGFMGVEVDMTTKKPKFTMDLLGDKTRKAKIRLPAGITDTNLLIVDPSFQKIQDLIKPTKQ